LEACALGLVGSVFRQDLSDTPALRANATALKVAVRNAASLHGPDVPKATPGVPEWFLRNGNLVRGIPSWSGLPREEVLANRLPPENVALKFLLK
jgi:hypothetical protein